MIVGMSLVACGFFYTLIVAILFFSKNRFNNFETKIYSILLILSLCNSVLEEWLCVNVLKGVELFSFYNLLLDRLFLVFIYLYFVVFGMYIIYISFYNTKEAKEKLKKKYGNNYPIVLTKLLLPFFLAIMVLLWILPIEQPREIINGTLYSYSTGPAVYVLYVVAGLVITTCFLCIFLNKRKTRLKKYAPFLVFAGSFSILLIVRFINPGILLNSLSIAFATFIMYHTIENPDLKVIKELTEAKDIAEHSNNNKSTFLFNVVNKLRTPINNISRIGNEILEEKDTKVIKEGVQLLVEENKTLETLINDVLDISSVDVKNLKVYKSKYNINLLLKSITTSFSKEINNKNIDFRINIENDLPKTLYGDSIRIKQIINTLLTNALKYTEKGFIELRVTSVIKYDVCRLIIAVDDSGNGMSLEKSSKIFYDYGQDIELDKIDENDMNLSVVKKLVDVIGGNIMVKSTEGRGTEIVFVLDQKIDEDKDNIVEEEQDDLKVLFIDNNNKEYNKFIKLLNMPHIAYKFALGGQKGLESIRKGNIYDYIFIMDDLEKLSAIDTLNKIKLEEKSNSKVIIITKKENKDKYKELGFDNSLELPLIKEDLEKIIKL